MRTIKVTPDSRMRSQLVVLARRAQATDDEVSDQVAAGIAALWQSSGASGQHLAALASGAEVDTINLHKDVSDAIWDYYRAPETTDDDRLLLDMLGTWSLAVLRAPEPTEEHIILVAFSVTETDRKAAQERLLPALQPVLESNGGPAESWWVAEDDRIDGSDNDSAVFVPMGSQEMVSSMLARSDLTPTWNMVRRETDEPDANEGTEFAERHPLVTTPGPDQRAIDSIANILAAPEWDVAALEWIADVVGEVRPHPGGHATRNEYRSLFLAATGRDVIDKDES